MQLAQKPKFKVTSGQTLFASDAEAARAVRVKASFGGYATYESGASAGRHTSVWQPPLVSGDVATLPNIDKVAARAYDSIRNDPYLSNAVRIARDSIIGNGFRLRLHPDHTYLGISFQEAMDWARKAQAIFRVHSEGMSKHSDAMGQHSFTRSMQTQLVTKIASGSNLGLIRAKERITTPQLTCMQKIDPARIRNPMGQADNDRFRKGVELDDDGQPIAIHIANRHPNDYNGVQETYRTVRVPIKDRWGRYIALHGFNQSQVDMHHGISEMVSALVPGRMLSEFNRVHLESAIAQSVFAATIKSDLNYADAMQVVGADSVKLMLAQNQGLDPSAAMQLSYLNSMNGFYRERAMQLNGAQVNHLAPHEELQLHRAETINNGAAEFDRSQVRRVAAGVGSPVHNMSQDYQSLSYASGRIAETNSWRHFKVERDHISEDTGIPYAAAVIEEEIITGRFEMPGNLRAEQFYEYRDALMLGEFMSWGKPVIDPVKERKGQQLQLQMGSTSLTRICDEEGVDINDIISEVAWERQQFEIAGEVYPERGGVIVSEGENTGESPDPDEDELRDAGVLNNG